MVREFKLVNEKGQEYSLMDIENYCLLSEPSGLGYNYSTEYEQLGNTFIETLKKMEQGQISGTANFLSYDNYNNLVNFIEASEKLQILYKIPFQDNFKEYLRDINIQELTKTEKQTDGIIKETLTLECLSLWYTKTTKQFTIEAEQEDVIKWDFKWDSKFSDFSNRQLEFINDGHIDAPITIEINGAVKNPKIYLYVEGKLKQELLLNVEIQQYEKILYGTKENDFYILKENIDGTTENLYNLDVLQNFDKIDEIIRLPKQKSCMLTISAENDIQSAKINVFTYYKAV